MKSELDLLFWTVLLCVGIASVILSAINCAKEPQTVNRLCVVVVCLAVSFPLFQILLRFLNP